MEFKNNDDDIFITSNKQSKFKFKTKDKFSNDQQYIEDPSTDDIDDFIEDEIYTFKKGEIPSIKIIGKFAISEIILLSLFLIIFGYAGFTFKEQTFIPMIFVGFIIIVFIRKIIYNVRVHGKTLVTANEDTIFISKFLLSKSKIKKILRDVPNTQDNEYGIILNINDISEIIEDVSYDSDGDSSTSYYLRFKNGTSIKMSGNKIREVYAKVNGLLIAKRSLTNTENKWY